MSRQPASEYVEDIIDSEIGHPMARGMTRAADVRGNNYVGELKNRIVRIDRLSLGYVEARAGEVSRAQRLGECRLIDDGAASGVHEDCAALHSGKFASSNQMM